MKKVIVAGAGHGGLVSAILLAREGFDVTVFESKRKHSLGYDWKDQFDLNDFTSIGIKFSDDIKYEKPEPMIFYSPTLIFKKKQILANSDDIKMDRRLLYKALIKNAIESGVKIFYNKKIVAPIVSDNRVVGVKTFFRSHYADLIIDSCGIFSPLKKKLKKIFNLDCKVTKKDAIYTYRAGYMKKANDVVDEKHRVYLFPNDSRGISWVSDEGNKTDILIGRFFSIDKKDVNDELHFLRKCNKISNFRVSGGGYYVIPVRKPMSQIVYDGYVLIGDSAYMTIPLIGSGISLCAKAGKILADVLIKNKDKEYNVENLWEYQARFFREIGYDLAFKSVFKDIVYELDKDEVDFVFQNDIITDDMITTITASDELNFDINYLLTKGKKGLGNPKLMVKLGKTLLDGKIRSIVCKNIPLKYDKKQVDSWKVKYEK